jgi:two-component system cell cycle sensor histidine kinase PleC
VKFTPQNGRITIETRRERDGGFSIVVRDNGIGMCPDDIQLALQPFGQADAARNVTFESVGLGLSIANMIAQDHGGTVRVASAPGRGTVAVFALPALRIVSRGHSAFA